MHNLTMIRLYSVPMNVNGTVRVSGLVEESSPVGPKRSFAAIPNGKSPENPVIIMYVHMHENI